MGIRTRKPVKRDLLSMPSVERTQLIMEIKGKLREKMVEAKLWQSFADAENLTINGKAVCSEDVVLNGLSISDLSRGV
jgi:hypothetical protein